MEEPIQIYSQIQPLVKKEIDDKIANYATNAKYNVAQIPAHVHNGVDSGRIDYSDLENIPLKSYCKMYSASAQTTTATSNTVIDLDTTSFSNEITPDTTNHKVTITQSGYYYITGVVTFSSPVANKSYNAYIYKNGSLLTKGTSHSAVTDAISSTTSELIYLVVGDYIELRCMQNSGSNIDTKSGGDETYLTIFKI